jgi:hypothetical protein
MARTKTRQTLILELRTAVADITELRNRVYAAERAQEESAQPFRIKIRELEQSLETARQRLADTERRAGTAERAFYAIAAAVYELHLASGKEPR